MLQKVANDTIEVVMSLPKVHPVLKLKRVNTFDLNPSDGNNEMEDS